MHVALSIAVLSTLVLVASGSVAAGPDAAPGLAGTAWKLVELPGSSLAAGVSSTLTFDAGGVASGSDGCNRYRGAWTATATAVRFSPLAGTQMACPEPVMRQANAFTTALGATRAWSMDSDRLILLAGRGGRRLAAFVPLPIATLQGTAWEAVGVNNGKQAVTSLVQGSAITAVFGADGTVAGSAGCNRYTARYTTSGDTIAITRPTATRKMCRDPAVMAQEQQYLTALPLTATHRLDEHALELRSATGALQVKFRAP